jgi:hypothetical protein
MRRNGRRRPQARQTSPENAPPADPTPNDHPRLPPNAIETLVVLVTAGQRGSDLPLLYNTIGERLHAIQAARFANALARLGIGDRVRIGRDVSPGYIHGLPATVVKRDTQTTTVQLDRPIGKFTNGPGSSTWADTSWPVPSVLAPTADRTSSTSRRATPCPASASTSSCSTETAFR